jgi:hypothetical protein
MAYAGDLKQSPREPEEALPEKQPDSKSEQEQAEAPTGQSGAVDAVESALALALTEATKAQRWELVAQLAGELEARRRARLEVPDLAAERKKRGRT